MQFFAFSRSHSFSTQSILRIGVRIHFEQKVDTIIILVTLQSHYRDKWFEVSVSIIISCRGNDIPNSIHDIRLIVTIAVTSNIIGFAKKIDTRNILHWMQWTTYNSLSSHWHLPTLSMKANIDPIICETSIISDPLLPLYKIFFSCD